MKFPTFVAACKCVKLEPENIEKMDSEYVRRFGASYRIMKKVTTIPQTWRSESRKQILTKEDQTRLHEAVCIEHKPSKIDSRNHIGPTS